VTPEESTHVDTFTGTTSFFLGTVSGRLAAVVPRPPTIYRPAPPPRLRAKGGRCRDNGRVSRIGGGIACRSPVG
jgi:hypothetical protein